MPPSKIRFVTACQQVLALGAVLAVLTPAAGVVSLDVVHDRQEQGFVTPLTEHRGSDPASALRRQTGRTDRADRCVSRHRDHRVLRPAGSTVAEPDRTRC